MFISNTTTITTTTTTTTTNNNNKMQTIGSLAIAVLRYRFGIIKWHKEKI
jgi:hypothetical protein